MLAPVMGLRFDPVLEASDDGPLQEFLEAGEVFAVRDHFLFGTRWRTGQSALIPNARRARC